MDFYTNYPRDFCGYGGQPPHPQWPNDARVAISIVLNIEAGAELSLADGDERNEFIYEIQEPIEHVPNYALMSHFDYGPRVGYWRIMRVLEQYGVPSTISSAGRSIERMPWLAQDAVARGHEVSAHGYRWENHSPMAESEERALINKIVHVIENACGERPLGWHTKGAPSPNTRRLLAESGFLYDSDVYDDDLPRIQTIGERKIVLVPYAFDTNDMRYQAMPGGLFTDGSGFARCCIEAFDQLWAEGAEQPAMMSLGIHPRYIGRPSRIGGLIQFLEHVNAKGGAWFARRRDIAEHWMTRFG